MTKPLLLQSLQGKITERTPIWMMRQAGRHLPEYMQVRGKFADFLSFCYTPEAVEEVTLQPVERYDFDAAILFSDILVIPDALGQNVGFTKGIGPQLEPLSETASLAHLRMKPEALHPVLEGLGRVRKRLDSSKALLGFCGCPWTLACYMIEGGGSRDYASVVVKSYLHREWFAELMDILTDAVAEHAINQIEAGADAIQLFDSWAGVLTPEGLAQWAIEPPRKIISRIKQKHPHTPVIGFPRHIGHSLRDYAENTGADALSIDQFTALSAVCEVTALPLQGNLDPLLMANDLDTSLAKVDNIMDTMRGRPFVFNLGHGVVPSTPIKHVEAVVERVRQYRFNRDYQQEQQA